MVMSGVCVIIGNIYLIFVDVYFKKGGGII